MAAKAVIHQPPTGLEAYNPDRAPIDAEGGDGT